MNLHPKKILVATDFSPDAREAADAAGALSRVLGGEITLLHVVPLSLYADEAARRRGTFSTEELEAGVKGEADREGLAEVSRLAAEGVTTTFLTVDGPPAAEIARVAKEQACDLVVIATHGQTGLRHLVMGSVAEDVARLAPCSVLVVRGAVG